MTKRTIKQRLLDMAKTFSVLGLFIGFLFMCTSLTPSLLPRIPVVQGTLAGVSFVVGYGAGKLIYFVWWYFGGPDLQSRQQIWVNWVLVAIGGGVALVTFSKIAVWQNTIRTLMEMPPVESGYPFRVAVIAFLVAFVLLFVFRSMNRLGQRIVGKLGRILPHNTAVGLGGLLTFLLIFVIINDLFVQNVLRVADEVFAEGDQILNTEVQPPEHRFASGGPASIIAWEDIGKKGKLFLTTGPTRANIATFSGPGALEPIRVYAGFRSADTFAERAELALQELINMGGFERKVMIVATPTGTGWLDPAAVDPVTYIHGGDIAIVSSQYTYVPSWLSIMVEPDRSRLAAQALFMEIYNHWVTLDPQGRPELYLFGLSLGALGSEAAVDLITLFEDPIHGGLWSGPPFASTNWPVITAARNLDSPAWLPEFRDGALVRFMNQDGVATPDDGEWGRMRFIYLQYASDPMVFFSPDLAFERPDWLRDSRGRDVSPQFDWYPLVTFLQVAFDVPMATSTPSGYGHTYDALDYIEGWIAVTDPEGWTGADTRRLNAIYADFEARPI